MIDRVLPRRSMTTGDPAGHLAQLETIYRQLHREHSDLTFRERLGALEKRVDKLSLALGK